MLNRRAFIKLIGYGTLSIAVPVGIAGCSTNENSTNENDPDKAIKEAVVGKWTWYTGKVTWTFRFKEDGTFEAAADGGGMDFDSGNWSVVDHEYIHLDTMETWTFYIKNDKELWLKQNRGSDVKFAKAVD